MSGHNKWAQIKHKKAITDSKRAKNWTKLLSAITAAAKIGDPNPEFNPRLRTAVKTAKEEHIPAETIEKAIKKATDKNDATQEILMECYGPGGCAVLIEAITDNNNRTVPQIKKIISDKGGKWAEGGSVLWAFDQNKESREWTPKFPQDINDADAESLLGLVEAIEDHDDVQRVITNINEN